MCVYMYIYIYMYSEVLVKVEGSYRLFQGLCTPTGKTHKASDVRNK